MDEYKDAVAELLGLNEVVSAPSNQRRLAHVTSVDSLLTKTPTAHLARGVDRYSQMTPVDNQNQLLVDSADNTAVGTVTLHHMFGRRDEWQEMEQEKQEMLRRQGDLEGRELAVQQKQGAIAQDEYELKKREAECDKWGQAIRQNRTALQKERDRRKDEWRKEMERREMEWQQMLKEREVEAE